MVVVDLGNIIALIIVTLALLATEYLGRYYMKFGIEARPVFSTPSLFFSKGISFLGLCWKSAFLVSMAPDQSHL